MRMSESDTATTNSAPSRISDVQTTRADCPGREVDGDHPRDRFEQRSAHNEAEFRVRLRPATSLATE